MKKDRISLIAGFTPALCMGILMGFEYLTEIGALPGGLWMAAAAETAAFLLPLVILLLIGRTAEGDRPPLRLKGTVPHCRAFVFLLSLATPFGAFLLNYLTASLTGAQAGAQGGAAMLLGSGGQSAAGAVVLVAVLLPAVVEELFFRLGLMGSMESAGTWAAILISALSFALVHGTAANFAGPLFAGVIFGYMCFALGSVWPAVFAHLVSNLYAYGIHYFSGVYETFDLWGYFILVNVVCFCIFLYFAMRSLEKLIERGKIPRFKKSGLERLVFAFLSPGFLLLVLLFCLKTFYL